VLKLSFTKLTEVYK